MMMTVEIVAQGKHKIATVTFATSYHISVAYHFNIFDKTKGDIFEM